MASPIISSSGRIYDRKMVCAAARRCRRLRAYKASVAEIDAVVDAAMGKMAGCVPARVLDQIWEDIVMLRASQATKDTP